ncbi:MAG TPA: phosphopantetheine-binding protein [Bryobacteraceae bacterium]|jgi:acyl carrier protein|nr:phosphopantetheine-binding protein [Bryobacteraceae bacterium]
MSDELMARVIRVIAETQRISPDTIRPESTFEELKIDSLDGINILFALENEFNINIPDDAAKQVRSIQELAEGVEKLSQTASA